MNLTRPVLPLLLLAAPIVAQRTVIVDAANGAGTTYTTLQAAFTGMQENDTIVLRSGTYDGFAATTLHSFVLIGEGSPLVRPPSPSGAALSITFNGSQYQRVAITGVRFQSTSTGQWALTLRTNYNFWPEPTVHLEDCEVLSASPQQTRAGLLADAIGLTAQRCNLNTTQVIDGLASFVDCTIWGQDQIVYNLVNQDAETALDVLRSEVWITGSTLTAGNSHGVYGAPASCVSFSDYSSSTASHVYISGDCTLIADPAPNTLWPQPNVFKNYSYYYPIWPLVEREPGAVLVASPGCPVFGASVTDVQRVIPNLRASTAPLGGTWTCTVHGTSGDFAGLLAGLSSRAHRLLGHALLVDETLAVTVGVVLLPAGQETSFPIAVPNDASLTGIVFEASAGLLSPTGALDVTNPVSGVVH